MPDNWSGGYDRLRYVAGLNPEVAAIIEQQLGWLHHIDTFWLDDGLYKLAETGRGSTEALRIAMGAPLGAGRHYHLAGDVSARCTLDRVTLMGNRGLGAVPTDAQLLVTGKPIKRRDHLDAMLKLVE